MDLSRESFKKQKTDYMYKKHFYLIYFDRMETNQTNFIKQSDWDENTPWIDVNKLPPGKIYRRPYTEVQRSSKLILDALALEGEKKRKQDSKESSQ